MSQQQTEKINNENQNSQDEIEEQETQSVDGSTSSEPNMHSSNASETNDVSYNQTVNDIRLTLKGLNTRQLPSWDHNKKKRDSIKEHLLTAKELGKRLQWSDKELANEVMLSLTGESGTIARQFSQDIQNNFRLLEKELMKLFWVPKPKSQMLKEFNNLAWNPDRQKLQQFAVFLRGKLLKIFRGDTEEFNLKLRDRFIEAIKEVRPEFGRNFEMLDLDQKTEFWSLATYAQRKYDLYQNNTERIEEEQVLLSRELYAEEIKQSNKQRINWNTISNEDEEISQPIHYYDDFHHPEYEYQYRPAYTGQNFVEEPRDVKSYGIDDYDGLEVKTIPDQYIEQDFQSNWKGTTQSKNDYDEAQEHYEVENYYEDENYNEGENFSDNYPIQANRYYIPNQQSMHSYYNDYPHNRVPENEFYTDHSI